MLDRDTKAALDSSRSVTEIGGRECLGCTCGYTCGTDRALQRHLARFPGDMRHHACLIEGSPHGGRDALRRGTRVDVEEQEQQATLTSAVSAASSSSSQAA